MENPPLSLTSVFFFVASCHEYHVHVNLTLVPTRDIFAPNKTLLEATSWSRAPPTRVPRGGEAIESILRLRGQA